MKHKVRYIPIFHKYIHIIEVDNKKDAPNVKKILKKLSVPTDILDEVDENIKNEYINGALTVANLPNHNILVILYEHDNEKEKINSIAHEQRHVVDDILEICNIEDNETGAYIAGYLAQIW